MRRGAASEVTGGPVGAGASDSKRSRLPIFVSVTAVRTRAPASALSAVLRVGLVLLIGALLVGGDFLGASPTGAAVVRAPIEPARPVNRVLVISIPHVGWADLRREHATNLRRLLGKSAVANMTARSGGGGFAAGYLTLGAGKRSKGTDTPSDGMGFDVDDRFGDATAGDAFTRRTGVNVDSGLVQLGIVALQDINEAEAGGTSVGALGTALDDAGYSTAVIGNGDGSVPDDLLARYRRYAVAGLMDEAGTVSAGQVDRALLEPDADAPFGLRLDNDAVLAAFEDAWQPKSVVLVEGSDLLRAVASRPPSVESQDRKSYAQAIQRTDELVGELLDEIDFSRDAVVVLSPYGSRVTKGLTVVGVHAPGVEPGLMRSSSTRRNGFVLLADVAPTILRLVGEPRPTSMNGRPFVLGPTGGTPESRVSKLIDETDAAIFRDRVLTPVAVLVTVITGLVAIAAAVGWETRRRRSFTRPLRLFAQLGSSWILGFVPAVYLARLFPFHDSGALAYYAFVGAVAFVLAAVYEIAGSRRFYEPTAIGLGVVIGLLSLDVLTGARLQLSTAFGYTATIGVRFAGMGNVSYAFLGASTVLAAGLLAHRIGGRRGVWVAVGLMAVALVIDAAPFFGGDVGGVLSLTPAYLVTGILLFGARVRRRTGLWMLAAAVGALALMAAADLARPAKDRTHLGRLLTNARERGYSEITDVIFRKLNRNLDTWTTSTWRSMFAIGVVFVIYLCWRARPRLESLLAEIPEFRASLVGFAVLIVLGYAVNDSGVAIPGVMFVVLIATMVGLLIRAPEPDQSSASTDSVLAATPSH